jgi:hypothetical protein
MQNWTLRSDMLMSLLFKGALTHLIGKVCFCTGALEHTRKIEIERKTERERE